MAFWAESVIVGVLVFLVAIPLIVKFLLGPRLHRKHRSRDRRKNLGRRPFNRPNHRP